LTGGFPTGSRALFAEAAHSAADTTNQGLLLMSLSLGKRKPDEEHPFGHGKERFFWAFTASVMMFVAGAVFALALGVVTLFGEEHEAKSALVTYVILGLSLVVESYALYRAVSRARSTARREGSRFGASSARRRTRPCESSSTRTPPPSSASSSRSSESPWLRRRATPPGTRSPRSASASS
jgi:cation diffusion facilitator family transporter